jgi:hypothetical protein
MYNSVEAPNAVKAASIGTNHCDESSQLSQ